MTDSDPRLTDPTWWGTEDIARALGVQAATAKKLARLGIAAHVMGDDIGQERRLPLPTRPGNISWGLLIRSYVDPLWSELRWPAGQIRTWAVKTGRLSWPDLTPIRATPPPRREGTR